MLNNTDKYAKLHRFYQTQAILNNVELLCENHFS